MSYEFIQQVILQVTGMSWEWRVFLLEDKAVGLPALLGFGGYLPAEVRNDVYVSCTNEVGIKWRKEKLVEVKVRSERDDKTGAERWDKVFH
jgi:hypothetical protein